MKEQPEDDGYLAHRLQGPPDVIAIAQSIVDDAAHGSLKGLHATLELTYSLVRH